MGIVKLPNKDLYWSFNPNYKNKTISKSMSIYFFNMINTALHLTHEEREKNDQGYDPRQRLGKIIYLLNKKFPSQYVASQEIAIDETIVGFKGKSKMVFYIPSKPTKWGFKMHVLSESKSGYCCKILLDPGKAYKKNILNSKEYGSSKLADNIVLKLTEGYRYKGYKLYLDSWHASPNLFIQLRQKGIAATGIVKENRIGMPKLCVDKNF